MGAIQLDFPTRCRTFKMTSGRQRLVVVGLGMVGIAFIEKLMKYDARTREYDITVLGEESHLAYNRVGLTSYFEHRKIENLYLNSAEWYAQAPEGALGWHVNTQVTSIDSEAKTVSCANGEVVPYDVLVLATGSNAILPQHTPGFDARGVFVYRTIDDLTSLIDFAASKGISRSSRRRRSARPRSCKGHDGPRMLRQSQTHRTQPLGAVSATRR